MSIWTPQHVRAIRPDDTYCAPVITAADVRSIAPGLDIWDMWPLALSDGSTAAIAGGVLWFALTAPILPDPAGRHALARIRLFHQIGRDWRDFGDALPDGLSPGSREWAGSAIYDPGTGCVTLFFTAAGRRDEAELTFEQRLFQSQGALHLDDGAIRILDWSTPRESVASDGEVYLIADESRGAPGLIRAFRDPAYFRDPVDGRSYLTFAACLPTLGAEQVGAVGIAQARDASLNNWDLCPPLLHAAGLNRELERPHIIYRDGLYYLFWCTQRHTFVAGDANGPDGLYGMVSDHLVGPYRPLNGTGLVLANPNSEPHQAYAWWVMGDGAVTSFTHYWGMTGRRLADHPELLRLQFGGGVAPFVLLQFDGDQVRPGSVEPAV